MAAKKLPEQSILLQLLRYEPNTGKLFWRQRGPEWFKNSGRYGAERSARMWNAKCAGKEAFLPSHSEGYCQGAIFGERFLAHRVIWKMVYDTDPIEIDHINGVRSDNRIENLRSVTALINMKNIHTTRRGLSGVVGVNWSAGLGKWRVRINVDRREVHIGEFIDFDEAVAARKAAEREYGFHPNHGRAA